MIVRFSKAGTAITFIRTDKHHAEMEFTRGELTARVLGLARDPATERRWYLCTVTGPGYSKDVAIEATGFGGDIIGEIGTWLSAELIAPACETFKIRGGRQTAKEKRDSIYAKAQRFFDDRYRSMGDYYSHNGALDLAAKKFKVGKTSLKTHCSDPSKREEM